MKIAILSESPADEVAISILAEGILGQPIEVISRRVRTHGLDATLRNIPPALKELHYQRTADALVISIDSDKSPVHQRDHVPHQAAADGCRYCIVQTVLESIQARLTPIQDLAEIPTAIVVAVPAIEAWFQFRTDPNCTEAGWIQRQQAGTTAPAEIRNLKQAVYGTDRPGLALSKAKAVEHAERLAGNLDQLEQFFPNSFGLFAQQVRSWRL